MAVRFKLPRVLYRTGGTAEQGFRHIYAKKYILASKKMTVIGFYSEAGSFNKQNHSHCEEIRESVSSGLSNT